MRAPTAHHSLLKVLPEGPTPVTASVTGAESDVGENLIAQIFHTTIFLKQKSFSSSYVSFSNYRVATFKSYLVQWQLYQIAKTKLSNPE